MSESHSADTVDDERQVEEDRKRRAMNYGRVSSLIGQLEAAGRASHMTGDMRLTREEAALLGKYIRCLQRGLERQELALHDGAADAFRARTGVGHL
jgi:hypothetical protein